MSSYIRQFWRKLYNNTGSIDDVSTLNHLTENESESASSSGGYTELTGSVPCPSCKGTGLIPKELESTLVALIPVNDDRLKPKKTWIYVVLWTIVCATIGGLFFFLLMPRSVVLNSDELPVFFVIVTDRNATSPPFIKFHFTNSVNITSGNYLPVELVNITSTVISKFQPWSSEIIGAGENSTFTDVYPLYLYRNTKELEFNNTVLLKDGVAEYCQASFSRLISLYVSLQFNVAVTLRYYYGHQEQVMISTQQQVCCIPTGNCSSP